MRDRSAGWHKTTSIRRCCCCTQTIGKGERYYGDSREPLQLRCYGCKVRGASPVKPLAPSNVWRP